MAGMAMDDAFGQQFVEDLDVLRLAGILAVSKLVDTFWPDVVLEGQTPVELTMA